MKLSLGPILFLVIAAAACATAPADDVAASSDSALRELAENEILGEIAYGDTKEVDLTTTPKFRAFWFKGERGDQIQLTATALDATDPYLWFTDDQFNTIAQNNDARVTDTSALINGRYLPKTGKYFMVFRDIYNSPKAKFVVTVRKLGVLPPECDPDGEGTWDSNCTDPIGYDPFDPASCTGDALPPTAAKELFSVTDGFKPALARVYYRTRQCIDTAAGKDCSPWVYAFAMDVKLATVMPKENAPGVYTFATDSTRKTKIDFEFERPGAEDEGKKPDPFLTSACVDGPFAAGPLSATLGTDWSQFSDGSAGVCAAEVSIRSRSSKMTRTCARFELPTIILGSGEASHYTELNPVLHAKF